MFLLVALALAAQASQTPARILVLETRGDPAYVDKVKAYGDLVANLLEARTAAEIVPSSSVRDRLAVGRRRQAAERL